MSNLLRFALVLVLVVAGCSGPDGMEDTDPPPNDSGESATTYPSEPARIVIDEEGDDWDPVPVRHTDPTGDGEQLDLERLWISHDDEHLFLRFETEERLNLSENNDLTLYLDTDNDTTTGRRTRGLGAELTWTFGDRSGRVYSDGSSTEIGHADIGLSPLPTVRATTFEIALDRSARPGGEESLFEGDSIRVALDGPDDQLPDRDGGLGYAFSPTDLAPLPEASLEKPNDGLRLLGFNVLQGRLFESEARDSYSRVLDNVDADIIGFSEVYDRSSQETADRVAALTDTEGWHHAKLGLDLVAVSRYPIEETHTIPGYEDNESGAFLLDADEALGSPLLLILTHPPCCNFDDAQPSRDVRRQRVVDGIAAFLRDVKQGEGPFEVPENTPIVVAGDMNFVGDPQQPKTLRTGEIVNNDTFGPSEAPDWDDTSLHDTNPRQTGAPFHATWVQADSDFPPSRLDYVYISDSVLEVENEYVLRTSTLSSDRRSAFGVERTDTETTSDHLPLVVDVVPR
ncbi:MAG: endonuclease/exonuclease/phosphatase family protein [Salinivenus sp.]